MATEKLYFKDVYMKEGPLTLTRFGRDGKDRPFLVFASGFFFPEGGGQPCDTGTAGDMRVLSVNEDKETGDVIHYVDRLQDGLAEGQELFCRIDWEKRFDHMQMHCGEHILSGAFFRLFGAENKGFHMGPDYMTIDILFPEGWEGDPKEAGEAAELEANRVIWANVPIKTYFFATREEADKEPSRKKIGFDEDISLVFVGDREAPLDCCPCCGTHPSRSGEVGLVKVLRVDPNKAFFRYTLKSGRFALADYALKHDMLTSIAGRYSTGLDKLERAMDVKEAENNSARRELAFLKRSLIADEISKLKAALAAKPNSPEAESGVFAASAGKSINVVRYSLYSPDDLQGFNKDLEKDIKGVLVLVAEKEHTAIILTDGSVNAGRLVKENASIYGGKGGGSPRLARAIFAKAEDLDLYLDLIEKHLR